MEWMLMPLKRYAEFSGRSRRMEFWMWVLFQFLLGMVFMVLMMALGGAAMMSASDPGQMVAAGGIAMIIYFLWILVSLAFFIPNLAVTIRRLHDTNRSGWWVMAFWGPYLLMIVAAVMAGTDAAAGGSGMAGGMLSLIALLGVAVGGILLLVFMFLEGTRGPNEYGPDPKGQAPDQVFA